MRPPPLGVMPLWRWRELLPEPTPRQVAARERAVCGAVARRWVVGQRAPLAWLTELGLGEAAGGQRGEVRS